MTKKNMRKGECYDSPAIDSLIFLSFFNRFLSRFASLSSSIFSTSPFVFLSFFSFFKRLCSSSSSASEPAIDKLPTSDLRLRFLSSFLLPGEVTSDAVGLGAGSEEMAVTAVNAVPVASC